MNIKKTFNKNFDSETIVKMSKQFNLDAKIIELLFSRGVDTQEKVKSFLSPTKQDILDSFLLNDMQLLVDRINQAIKSNEKVLIFGDYDVDGICATAIMIKLFEHFGKKVDYFLPNRFIDGYGLTNEVIDKIKIQFNPSLIITVDCGISCWKEVEYAKSVGIEIAITDHHEISEKLPETIVVNAKIENQKYPFKFLCGAGLAYKIAYAFLGYEDSIELLTIATFATIADIVPLLSENRTLVSLGLKYLPTHLPLGLKSLIKKNKLDISNLTSSDISYKLAPKINASGRMGEASDSLDLILENNPLKIKEIIEKINSHNLNRQDLCNKVFAEAVDLLKEKNMSKIRCIILKSDKWDSGILGIIAARLVDMFNRPTFLFSETDGELKGSGRSLENINIHEMLTSSSELLSTFGGHTMAAGLSLSAKNYNAFCEKIDKYMQLNINDMLLEKNAYYDLDVTPNELNQKFLNDLNRLEPFGCENQKPLVKINSQNFSIFPLKKFPQHANIEFDKKINLIFFNYIDKVVNLSYFKTTDFIFEIQGYANGQVKGIVRNVYSQKEIKETAKNIGDSNYIFQLKYSSNNSPCKCSFYSSADLTEIVKETKHTVFGTLFVANLYETYLNFLEKQDVSGICDFELFNMFKNGGNNSIVYAPDNFENFNNFSKIVFLDSPINNSFISYLNGITDAEIFVPENGLFPIKTFSNIDTSREKMGMLWNAIAKINAPFPNFQKAYQFAKRISKTNFSYAMFVFAICVFEELKLIHIEKNDNTFNFTISDKHAKLQDSTIYNFLNLLNKTTK